MTFLFAPLFSPAAVEQLAIVCNTKRVFFEDLGLREYACDLGTATSTSSTGTVLVPVLDSLVIFAQIGGMYAV
jgi:hypothetical protein